LNKFKIFLIIVAIVMLVSCKRQQVPEIFDANVTLKNINVESIPELKFNLTYNAEIFKLIEADDGFIGCDLRQVKPDEPIGKVLVIHKIAKNGELIWTKEHSFLLKDPVITAFLNDNAGNLYLALQERAAQKSYILKCNSTGEEVWRREFTDLSNSLFENVFITKGQELVAVGNWRWANEMQTEDHSIPLEAVITKLDNDGNLLAQKSLPRFQHHLAKYDPALGIVINASQDSTYANTIIKLDPDCNIEWSYGAAKDEFFNYKVLEVVNGQILIVGNTLVNGYLTNSFLAKLNQNGTLVWKKENIGAVQGTFVNDRKEKIKIEKMIEQVVVREDGDIIANNYSGLIIIFDQLGNEKQRLKLELGGIIKLVNDGGLILSKQRILGRVPPPFEAAREFYNTDLVIAKYDRDYKLEWRKTFDKYINSFGYDYVYILNDGTLIVQ